MSKTQDDLRSRLDAAAALVSDNDLNDLIEKLKEIPGTISRMRPEDSLVRVPVEGRPKALQAMATMLAAQAKAAVEARYLMALHRPRNWDDVRQRVLAECRRPSFAHNKSVWYRKPVGKGIEGLGIRFVEMALRCMTNVLVETTPIHDDESIRILQVSVTDLEANLTGSATVNITKTVERSKPLEDRSYLSVRTNSQGHKTYTIPANDDDIANKQGALVSKTIRTQGLRVIPGDLQDECREIILGVRRDEAARDPAAERKRLADGFSGLNVMPSELSDYLGHDFGACSPAELIELRGLWGAISEGETTWATALREARHGRADDLGVKLKEEFTDKEEAGQKPADAPPPPQPTPPPSPQPAGVSRRQRAEAPKGMSLE